MSQSKFVGALAGLALLTGCGGGDGTTPAPEENLGQGMSWEEFLSQVYQEPDTGIFIADGDVPFATETQLRAFYERNVRHGQLIVHRVGGQDSKWDDTQKRNLTYCVSTAFGSRYNRVVQAMASAAATWESAGDVKFAHVSAEDASCTASNNNVVFDVRPFHTGGQALARAFFPSDPRSLRSLLFDPSAFQALDPFTLEGVTRHELGHVLGFHHEHTRPEAGICFEGNDWRALTAYDGASVMHYPLCNGSQQGDLVLTAKDIEGIQALYGAPSTGGPWTATRSGTVPASATVHYKPFPVVPGSTFTVRMTGVEEPDLYVRLGEAPSLDVFDCRPYLNGATETCSLQVPVGVTTAHVMVHGYGYIPGAFSLVIDSLPPVGSASPLTWEQWSSYVNLGDFQVLGPYAVKAGTQLRVVMTGTGELEWQEPDLYVRFGAAPTLEAYDCRPYDIGSNETCDLTVPAGQSSAYVLVHGYTFARFNLDIAYTAP